MTDPSKGETTLGGTPKPKHSEIIKAQMAEIPEHRQEKKSDDTKRGWKVVCVGVLLLGLRSYIVPEIPWWAAVAVMLFGFFSMDKEWVTLNAKLAAANIRELKDAVLGGPKGEGTP